jgi:hypothetical protein
LGSFRGSGRCGGLVVQWVVGRTLGRKVDGLDGLSFDGLNGLRVFESFSVDDLYL